MSYIISTSSFEQLLQADNSVFIHQKSLLYLEMKIYKVKMGFSPLIMTEVEISEVVFIFKIPICILCISEINLTRNVFRAHRNF